MNWPTLEEALNYLFKLGFVASPGRPGFIFVEHLDEGCWLVFRERERNTPAREVELLNMRTQLTWRGFVSDDEFAQFWSQNGWRMVQPVQSAT